MPQSEGLSPLWQGGRLSPTLGQGWLCTSVAVPRYMDSCGMARGGNTAESGVFAISAAIAIHLLLMQQ